MNNTGNRIKFFRKRAGLTQSDLELSINAATGSVSRLEAGKVQPTKDTVLKIAEVLNLNPLELDYLIGPKGTPITQEEIENAKNEVKGYFRQKGVMAYILDDRWRVWTVSKTFQRILKLSDETVEELFGKNLMTVILDKNVNLLNLLEQSKLKEVMYYQLARFYREIYFMADDPVISEVIQSIKQNKLVENVWKEVLRNKGKHEQSIESRRVYFNLKGITVELNYSRDKLQHNPRFEIIEYVPTNKIIKLYSSLFL